LGQVTLLTGTLYELGMVVNIDIMKRGREKQKEKMHTDELAVSPLFMAPGVRLIPPAPGLFNPYYFLFFIGS